MPAHYQLIFRVTFGHAYFADGVLRDLRIVPVPACFDMLRRAGLVLRPQEDGIAAYGDEKAVARLRLHIAQAGAPLGMAFQVFFTDPHFFAYTAPAWPNGQLLFLDTADSVTDDNGRQIVHATPFVEASAFLERDHVRLAHILGERALAPTPAMVIEVQVSGGLLEVVDSRWRHFHVRFDAAGKDRQGGRPQAPQGRRTNDADGGAGRDCVGVQIADRGRAHLFLAKGAMPAHEVPSRRPRLRTAVPAADDARSDRAPSVRLG